MTCIRGYFTVFIVCLIVHNNTLVMTFLLFLDLCGKTVQDEWFEVAFLFVKSIKCF